MKKLIADYGMVFVLWALCVFFSAITLKDQHPTGLDGADAVASQLISAGKKDLTVLVVGRSHQEDQKFTARLKRLLLEQGFSVETVNGEPSDARKTLKRLAAEKIPLGFIAGNQVTSGWLVFADLPTDFPELGTPKLVQPESYRWPDFLKRTNLLNISNQIAVIAILAIGMTVVIITAGIDLSVGSLIAVSAVVACLLIERIAGGLQASVSSMILCCLAGIVICAVFGLLTGLIVTQFDVPPFIVTLAVMLIGRGVASQMTEGLSVYQVPDSFVWLGRGADFLGLPNAVVLMLVLYAIAHVMMSKMRIGRAIYAVGGNREAARLSGVPVTKVILFAYICSGALAGLGGVVMASQLKSGSPTYGQMYELYTIAAVIVGGTSIAGGQGKMFGTLIGAFIIAVIQNGMNLIGIQPFMQLVVLGLIILAAVLAEKGRRKLFEVMESGK
jgi:ribose transport system permease protein